MVQEKDKFMVKIKEDGIREEGIQIGIQQVKAKYAKESKRILKQTLKGKIRDCFDYFVEY
jgi:hypothetical protein